jgi:Tol biopolymer transport system component
LKTNHFVPYLGGISAEMLDFSKSGEWVTYVAYPQGTLWRSKVDGTQRLQLTFPPLRACMPRWSPDNQRIAFFSAAAGNPWKIYIVSTEGGVPQQLMKDQRNEQDPIWLADGNSLIFHQWSPSEGSFNSSIQWIDLRTKQISTLPGSSGLFAPRLSPDGRYLSASPFVTKKRTLLLYDLTTEKWTELVDSVVVHHRSWSGDGQYIYFDSAFFETPALFRVRVSDRKLERLVSLKDFRLVSLGPFGPWSGLTPDNSPLLLRDIGSQDIYALDLEAP